MKYEVVLQRCMREKKVEEPWFNFSDVLFLNCIFVIDAAVKQLISRSFLKCGVSAETAHKKIFKKIKSNLHSLEAQGWNGGEGEEAKLFYALFQDNYERNCTLHNECILNVFIKVYTRCLYQYWLLKKVLEGSNFLFYFPGYTLHVTLRKLAYFSQLTFLRPKIEANSKIVSVNFLPQPDSLSFCETFSFLKIKRNALSKSVNEISRLFP